MNDRRRRSTVIGWLSPAIVSLTVAMFLAGVAIPTGADAAIHFPTVRHLACDDPTAPDYEVLVVSPKNCYLGLAESEYQAQPVPGHAAPPAIHLRGLRWRHWGRRRAVGRGVACLAFTKDCAHAVIRIWEPMRIAPAAELFIYQHIRVRLGRIGGSPPRTAWYEPGLDY